MRFCAQNCTGKGANAEKSASSDITCCRRFSGLRAGKRYLEMILIWLRGAKALGDSYGTAPRPDPACTPHRRKRKLPGQTAYLCRSGTKFCSAIVSGVATIQELPYRSTLRRLSVSLPLGSR